MLAGVMDMRAWMVSLVPALVVACGGDSGSSGSSSADATSNVSTTTAATTTTTSSTTSETTSISAGASSSSTSGGTSGGSTGATSLLTTGPTCDPRIPGEWNACVDDNGNVDNTLCNWHGLPNTNGFIGCLNSSQNNGANVCFISDCVDPCDCFAPPSTGTAQVVCSKILQGGGNGCALDCSNGATCPDGMVCQDNLCFWPGSGGGSTTGITSSGTTSG